jgi:hypothetical protein
MQPEPVPEPSSPNPTSQHDSDEKSKIWSRAKREQNQILMRKRIKYQQAMSKAREKYQPTTSEVEVFECFSKKLIKTYFITATGQIKRPEHHIYWWRCIFSYLNVSDYDRLRLRLLCRLFRDSLHPPPSGTYTVFPHPLHTSLHSLIESLRDINRNCKFCMPKFLFLEKGTHDEKKKLIDLDFSIDIVGSGRENTVLLGGIRISTLETATNINISVKNLTISGAKSNGLHISNRESNTSHDIILDNVLIEKCSNNGVCLQSDHLTNSSSIHGKFNDIEVRECGLSGIFVEGKNVLATVSGHDTSIHFNCTRHETHSDNCAGLNCGTSAKIDLIYPLNLSISKCNDQDLDWREAMHKSLSFETKVTTKKTALGLGMSVGLSKVTKAHPTQVIFLIGFAALADGTFSEIKENHLLMPQDLFISINGVFIDNLKTFTDVFQKLSVGESITFLVKRCAKIERERLLLISEIKENEIKENEIKENEIKENEIKENEITESKQ